MSTTSTTSLSNNSDSSPWCCTQHRIHRDSGPCTDLPPPSPIVDTPEKRARRERKVQSQKPHSQISSQATPFKAPRPQQSSARPAGSQEMASSRTAQASQRSQEASPLATFQDSGVILPSSPEVPPSPPPAKPISPLNISSRQASPSSQRDIGPVPNHGMAPEVQVAATTTNRSGSREPSVQYLGSESISETPPPNRPLPNSPATIARNSRNRLSRSPSVEAPSLPTLADADTAISPPEVEHLRASQRGLTTELAESTELIHRLRIRNTIQAADNVVNNVMLESVRHDRRAGEEQVIEERIQRKIWMGFCVMIALALGLFGYVGWWNGPEMEFVRLRRRERFGLG